MNTHTLRAATGEAAMRAAFVRLGVRLAFALCSSGLAYTAATWHHPHRLLMAAVFACGLASAGAIALVPHELLIGRSRPERFFVSWSLGYVALTVVLVLADGGAGSPMAMQFFVLAAMLALVAPLRSVSVVLVIDVLAYALTSVVGGVGDAPKDWSVAVALTCVGFLSLRQAQIQAQQRAGLREAEVAAHRRAAQQAAIAELGQDALSGIELDELFQRTVATLAAGLEVPYAVLLRSQTDSATVRVAAAVGWPEHVTVGADKAPQAVFTMSHRHPVIVEDSALERRFDARSLTETGICSSISAAVGGPKEEPWGVLAVHSEERAAFDDEDLHFVLAAATLLSDAVGRARSELELRHRSLHDPLTGLPNRALLIDRLEHALARSERDGSHLAVLFLDIDDFKGINDSLGHEAGDTLLKALAPRLDSLVRTGDTLARFGGDEFVVLCEGVRDPSEAVEVAERLLGAFEEPFQLESEVFVTASVGVATGESGYAGQGEALVRDADAAMYRAKERGRGRYEVFDDCLRERIVQRVRTESELRRAVERNELRLVWQPIVRLGTGRVHAAEALVRWQHPTRGLLTPDQFIPVAEETGLIVPLGEWVIRESCRQAAAWMRSGDGLLSDFRVGVNLSARQLADENLVQTIRDATADAGLARGRVVFEITESTLMEDPDRCAETLRHIADLGLGVAVDDFGTGYSSLAYLKHLNLDAIKLDRSLVTGVAQGTRDSAIVEAVVAMSRALDLRLIAEGVECEEELRELRRLGCDLAQGFYFARPVPARELEALVAEGIAWPQNLPNVPERLMPPPPVEAADQAAS